MEGSHTSHETRRFAQSIESISKVQILKKKKGKKKKKGNIKEM